MRLGVLCVFVSLFSMCSDISPRMEYEENDIVSRNGIELHAYQLLNLVKENLSKNNSPYLLMAELIGDEISGFRISLRDSLVHVEEIILGEDATEVLFAGDSAISLADYKGVLEQIDMYQPGTLPSLAKRETVGGAFVVFESVIYRYNVFSITGFASSEMLDNKKYQQLALYFFLRQKKRSL